MLLNWNCRVKTYTLLTVKAWLCNCQELINCWDLVFETTEVETLDWDFDKNRDFRVIELFRLVFWNCLEFTWMSRLGFWNCQAWDSQSRPCQDKMRPPRLNSLTDDVFEDIIKLTSINLDERNILPVCLFFLNNIFWWGE